MTLVQLSDTKQATLSTALRQLLTSKQINEMVRFLEDTMTNDVSVRREG